MSQMVIAFLEQYGLSPEIIVFIISLLPILELRGGLIAASFFRIPMMKAFMICFAGNILPIPFILLFIKEIFKLLRIVPIFAKLIDRLESSALRKSESVRSKQSIGLFLFVAIPLPGTGGWTGALIASLLDMPIRKSFALIGLGVFCAGLIMLLLTYFAPGLFGF